MGSRFGCRSFVFASFALPYLAAVAHAQDTIRVSTDSAGNEANDWSDAPGISSDGRVICFSSYASNLIVSDNNGVYDVFVNDRALGIVSRVSVDSSGLEGNDHSYSNENQTLSDDGRVCVFDSDATNLCASDTNGVTDVFVHDRSTGSTVRVSVNSNGKQGNNYSYRGVISAGGNVVAFASFASNLVASDRNHVDDVFVHDLTTGVTERISVDSQGNEADGRSDSASLSADGRYVAFSSEATNLVPGDQNGEWDVFVRDRISGTTERVSVDSSGKESDGRSVTPSISSDGRYVAFTSFAKNLVPIDFNGAPDVFLVDRSTGSIQLCSVNDLGIEGNAESYRPRVSSSGDYVAFESFASNLVTNDGNQEIDCFVRDVRAATTTRISVDSNGGEANYGSYELVMSGDESVFAFVSLATNLAASDTNAALDVFVHELCSAKASRANYGQGLAGTNGVPALTANQDPVLGTTITIDLANSLGAPTVGVLLIGVEQGAFKTKFGADVLVKPLFLIPISFSYGGDSFSGALPTDVDFCETTVVLQALELDPGAPFGVSFTDGLELDLGR